MIEAVILRREELSMERIMAEYHACSVKRKTAIIDVVIIFVNMPHEYSLYKKDEKLHYDFKNIRGLTFDEESVREWESMKFPA